MARSLAWRIRSNMYKFLEQRTGTWNMVFHMTVFGYVLVALGLSSMLTEEDEINRTPLQRVVYNMEVSLAVYFTAEFILRLWAVGADARYQGCYGRLRFLARFVCLVDLIILGATVMLLAMSTDQGRAFGPGMVQHVRLMQMFRLFHFDRQMTTWRIIRDMVRMSRFELVSAYYITFLVFLALSASVFISESYNDTLLQAVNNETTPTFRTYGDAMWFSIISLMTVGYGDIVPRAGMSKAITCVLGFCAFCMFMTSSTLIGVGLTLMVQDRSKEKMRQKVRNHAARLLQTWYRRHLLNTDKYQNIKFFRDNLFRKLYVYEKMICKAAEITAAQQQKLKTRRSSALTQSLLKQVRKKSIFDVSRRNSNDIHLEHSLSALPALLHQSDIIAAAAIDDRLLPHTLSAPDSADRKVSLVDRIALVHNKSATSMDKMAQLGELGRSSSSTSSASKTNKQAQLGEMGRSTSSMQSYYDSYPSSPSITLSPTTKELPIIAKSEEAQPGRVSKMGVRSLDSETEKGYGSGTTTPLFTPNRSRANSVDTVTSGRSRQASIAVSIDEWHTDILNERTIRKYGILMQFIYYLRFLANRTRFTRARKPFELKDIETELHDMELQRLAKLKELQVDIESRIGAPMHSLLSKGEKTRLNFAKRLEICEQKLGDIERNTAMVLQLADAIARQFTPSNVAPMLKFTTPAQRSRLLQRKGAYLVRPESALAS